MSTHEWGDEAVNRVALAICAPNALEETIASGALTACYTHVSDARVALAALEPFIKEREAVAWNAAIKSAPLTTTERMIQRSFNPYRENGDDR